MTTRLDEPQRCGSWNTEIKPSCLLAALLFTSVSTAMAQSDETLIQRLDAIAGAGVNENRAIGLVAAVVRGEDTLLLNAYGNANAEWDVPMTTDAMFEVGSIAKQFTAAAILQLSDAGKLSLDDPITKWLPDLDASGDTVTLRRMLSHTSGINHFTETREWEMNAFTPGLSRDFLYPLIAIEPFQFPPGRAQAYNNSAFWLLGLVVENASGMRYEDYVRTMLFEPLGMTRSMYCDSSENVHHRAHGYGIRDGVIQRAPVINYTLVFAPGAICSTAGDLINWLKALHRGRVLSSESYVEMTTPATLEDGTMTRYGMGIKIGETYSGLRFIGHGGTAPGFRADATWYPDAQLAVVVLVNSSFSGVAPLGVAHAIAMEMLPSVRPELRCYTGDPTELVGRYEHVVGGTQGPRVIEVTQGPDGLAFSVNGSPPQTLPWSDGLEFYANENVTLTFHHGNDARGPVIELRADDAGNHRVFVKQ